MNSPSLDYFAMVDNLFCVCPTFTLTAIGDVITSDVINNCKQWQLQCVGINMLYNLFHVMIKKKIYCTAHV